VSVNLALITVVHVGVLALHAWLAWQSVVRGRMYALFFIGVAFYQAVSIFTLASVISEFGILALLKTEVITLVGTLLVWSVVLPAERMLPRAFAPRESNRFGEVVGNPGKYFAVIGVCMVVVLAVMFRGGLTFLEHNWHEARLEATYADSLATLLLFVLFPATWVALRASHRGTAILLFLASLALFVVYGSRAALLTLPMAVLLDFLLRPNAAFRTSPRSVAMIAIAALALHVVGRIIRGFSVVSLLALLGGDSTFPIGEVFANLDWSGGEAAIFRYFLFVVADGPFVDIEPLTSVIRWVGIYVPSAFFHSKPIDVTYTLWWHGFSLGLFESFDSFREVMMEVNAGAGGSLHVTIWGEMWVNGGWLAVPVFALVLATLLLLIEAVYARLPAVPYVLAAPATLIGYIMVARGNSVIGLGYTAYVLPLALAAYGALLAGRACVRRLFVKTSP
jgi:hypothetical protein